MSELWCSCWNCKNYIKGNTCIAFDEIPIEIAAGIHDHRTPFDGDNRILFEEKVIPRFRISLRSILNLGLILLALIKILLLKKHHIMLKARQKSFF